MTRRRIVDSERIARSFKKQTVSKDFSRRRSDQVLVLKISCTVFRNSPFSWQTMLISSKMDILTARFELSYKCTSNVGAHFKNSSILNEN